MGSSVWHFKLSCSPVSPSLNWACDSRSSSRRISKHLYGRNECSSFSLPEHLLLAYNGLDKPCVRQQYPFNAASESVLQLYSGASAPWKYDTHTPWISVSEAMSILRPSIPGSMVGSAACDGQAFQVGRWPAPRAGFQCFRFCIVDFRKKVVGTMEKDELLAPACHNRLNLRAANRTILRLRPYILRVFDGSV